MSYLLKSALKEENFCSRGTNGIEGSPPRNKKGKRSLVVVGGGGCGRWGGGGALSRAMRLFSKLH